MINWTCSEFGSSKYNSNKHFKKLKDVPITKRVKTDPQVSVLYFWL